jgi:hypothetical protein
MLVELMLLLRMMSGYQSKEVSQNMEMFTRKEMKVCKVNTHGDLNILSFEIEF